MTIKKKPLVITIAVILALILVTSLFFLFTNKNVNIKATRIDGVTSGHQTNHKEQESKYAHHKLFIENHEELKVFVSKIDGQNYASNQPKEFDKYDEMFFEKNTLFIVQYSEVPNHKRLDAINRSYILEKKMVIEYFLFVSMPENSSKLELGINPPSTGYQRSFIFEIPKKLIKRYELTPEKIELESIYKGIPEEEYNQKYK